MDCVPHFGRREGLRRFWFRPIGRQLVAGDLVHFSFAPRPHKNGWQPEQDLINEGNQVGKDQIKAKGGQYNTK